MQLIVRTYRSTATADASPGARRNGRRGTLVACAAAAALGAPGAASAADTVVAPDPAAGEVSALDGTIVWVSGKFGDQVLMRRTPGGTIARVRGAPSAPLYRSIDLGHNRNGRLVLTYQRCTKDRCSKAFRDNLHGGRATYRHLTRTRCALTTAPAAWRTRLAYGLSCRKPNKEIDDKRSGLYVKTGSGTPRRLRLPKNAVRFGVTNIDSVDLRGTRAAAVAADVFSYAFTEKVDRSGLRSILSAASEGDSDEHTTGLALGSGGIMWTLTDAEHGGDPNQAVISRVQADCEATERLVSPAGPYQESGFRATDLAVDRSKLYLLAPGTGIVSHGFTPEGKCTPL